MYAARNLRRLTVRIAVLSPNRSRTTGNVPKYFGVLLKGFQQKPLSLLAISRKDSVQQMVTRKSWNRVNCHNRLEQMKAHNCRAKAFKLKYDGRGGGGKENKTKKEKQKKKVLSLGPKVSHSPTMKSCNTLY